MLIVTILIIITRSTACAMPARQSRLGNARESGRLLFLVRPVKSEPGRYKTLIRAIAWIILGIVLVAVMSARVRLAGLPLERDEGEYAYSGQLLLGWIAPFKLAYSMKFPGTAAVYALLMSIFGESANGVHFGLVVANLITVGLIFFLGRHLLGEISGAAAAAAYSIVSLM